MPPNVENAVYARGVAAWHGLGTVLPGLPDRDAVELAVPELAAMVERQELRTPGGLKAPGHWANVRTNHARDGSPVATRPTVVGVVKGSYRIYQGPDLMDLLEALLHASAEQGGDLRYESAGTLRGGSVVWCLARRPDMQILGEAVHDYLLACNSYDGSYSLTLASTPIRVECQNLLNYAIARADRVFRLAHRQNIEDRMAEARSALGMAAHYVDEVDELARRLVKVRLPGPAMDRFMNRLVPLPAPKLDPASGGALPSRARENAHALRGQIRRILAEAPDLAEHRRDGWGALQAVTAWWDHARGTRSAEHRMERLALSTAASLPRRAQKLLEDGVPV